MGINVTAGKGVCNAGWDIDAIFQELGLVSASAPGLQFVVKVMFGTAITAPNQFDATGLFSSIGGHNLLLS